MTDLKTILISIILLISSSLSGDYLYTECDSLQISGYIKSCKDSESCELEFFEMKIYPDSDRFTISSNDTLYSDLKSIANKPHFTASLNIFMNDLKIDTLKRDKETLFIINTDSFKDTLVYKKKNTNPSSFHFTRTKTPYIAYFTNIVKHKEIPVIQK